MLPKQLCQGTKGRMIIWYVYLPFKAEKGAENICWNSVIKQMLLYGIKKRECYDNSHFMAVIQVSRHTQLRTTLLKQSFITHVPF